MQFLVEVLVIFSPEATKEIALDTSLELLKKLRSDVAKIDSVPALASADYMGLHTSFESCSDQQSRIRDWLEKRLRAAMGQKPLRVASIGAGSGQLDVPLLEALANHGELHYVVVEPIEDQCRSFEQRFRASTAHGRVELDIVHASLGDVELDAGFDFVLAIHSLYYVDDLRAAVARLQALTSHDGRALLAIAPLEAMNQLAEIFWSRESKSAVWFASDVEHCLDELGLHHEAVRLDAELHLERRAFDSSAPADSTGRAVLDFLIHTPFGKLPPHAQQVIQAYLERVSDSRDVDLGVPHPVTLFEARH